MKKKTSQIGRGSSSSTEPGKKPAIAYTSQREAKSNLEGKLSLLVTELSRANRKELAADVIDQLPKSLRQFNSWAPIDSSGIHLLRNSRETLVKYPDLIVSIAQAIEAISAIRNAQLSKRSKEQTLAAARRTGSLHKTLREISERELIRMRSHLSATKKALQVSEGKLESMTKESLRLREEDKKEIEHLREENAKLQRLYRQVVPLKSK